jgi:hypothetical protein
VKVRITLEKYTHVWPNVPQPPKNTIGLLDFALEGGDSTREIARRIGLSSNTLNVARHRGRLSPTAAGALATYLGKDPVLWTAMAAIEAEPPSPLRDQLMARLMTKLNS